MHRNPVIIGLLIFTLLINALPGAAQDDPGPLTHVVQANENLYRIALNYNISVEALMQANGLTDPDLVMEGTTLIIPIGSSAPVAVAANPAPAAGTHTVAPGETLLQIARRYGLTVDDLIRANNIINPSLITVGQVLVIPRSTASPQSIDDNDLGIVGTTVEYAAPPPTPDLGILPAGAGAAPPPSEPEILVRGSEVIVIDTPPDNAIPETTTVVESAPPDDTAAAPDLGILPGGNPPETAPAVESAPLDDAAPPVEESAPADLGPLPADAAVSSPDLGIIPPGTAAWVLEPGIFSTGDAATVRAIFKHGQTLGNNPRAFSKIGDCNSELPFFLGKFDLGDYNLGSYAYLQPVIDQFAGSFGRQSMAVWTGNHAWAVFDATWSNPAYCQPGETPIACEFRINRPSLVLIRLGTNESGSPDLFETNLRQIIEFSIERGVIPVLGTKADRLEGSDRNNDIVRALAEEYGVPLWDFGRVADALPARGLLADGFHMSYVPPDYTAPAALQTGHSVQNLMALIELNTVWRNALY
jgi:LysM repeat protein